MFKPVFTAGLVTLSLTAGSASADIAPSVPEFQREVACERFVTLLEYEVEWFRGVEGDAATFPPENRPLFCDWLHGISVPDREALCGAPPPADFWPEFLSAEQIAFLVQISVAKSNLDAFANGLPPGTSVDLDYVWTYCAPNVQREALRLMRLVNSLQHPACLDACGNAITLPGISHSEDSCPEL